MTPHPLERYQSRIILQAILGLLITGALVGVSTALPSYLAARSNLEQLTLLNTESLGEALDHLLQSHQDLALQTASRSEIRKRLAQYARGELTLSELQRYTAPRLQEALGQIATLAGARRLGPQGEIVFTHGVLGAGLRSLLPQPALDLRIRPEDNRVLIQATAPIRDRVAGLVGADQLFFDTASIALRLQENLHFGAGSTFYIQLHHTPSSLLISDGKGLIPVPDSPALLSQLNDSQDSAHILHLTDASGPQVLFRVPLQALNANLLVKVPAATLYAPASQQLPWTLLYIFLMIVLGALITVRALQPITRRLLQQARRLEESGAELRLAASVFENAQEAIAITDANCRILRVNSAFSDICGHNPGRILGHYLYDLFDPEHHSDQLQQRVFEQLQQQDVWQGEIWYQRANHQPLPTLQTVSAVRDNAGAIIRLIHIFNDISEHKHTEAKMQRLAHYDALTGLANRAMIRQQLEAALTRAEQKNKHYALLFIDLDRFKPVNDTFGHHIGDELLKAVAKRMDHALREDDLLGRIGGDEFLVLLGGLAPGDYAANVARKLINLVSQPFQIGGQQLSIGASIGIALYPEDGTDPQHLLEQADAAMYEAKQNSRGGYCFAGSTRRSVQ